MVIKIYFVTYPVDSSTPAVRDVSVSHLSVYRAGAAAGFIYGLAEMPVKDVRLSDCVISMDPGAEPGMPAMMTQLEPMKGQGFFIRNAENIELHRVQIRNCEGELVNADETAGFTVS